MVRRFTLGLFKGLPVGIALAAAVVWGLGLPMWSAFVAYATCALAGAITGLIAGRPIWGTEAKLEAGLKAVVGAFVGVVATYGARKWLSGVHLDLSAFGAGNGALGDLPAAFLPTLTSLLAIFFELDNTEQSAAPKGPRRRVEAASSEAVEDAAFDEDTAEVKEARRRS